MPKLNLMPYPCQNLSWSILTPSFWKFPSSIIHHQFILLKRLLTEDFSRKTSSDRRFSSQNIFSQKISEPNVFSQKTQNSPPPVDLLEGDFSYYGLVKSPSVPPKGRTFVRPFLHQKDARSFVRFLALTVNLARATVSLQEKE